MSQHDTLTVVKLLAAGRPIPVVAMAVGLTGDQVSEIGGEHGWPDKQRLRDSARRIADVVTPAISEREPVDPGAPPEKRCSKCKAAKPESAFSADRRRPDGLCSQCKDCMRQAPSQRKPLYTASRAVRTRARVRAMRRLADLYAAEFKRLYDEEVLRARAELEPIKAAAEEKAAAGGAHVHQEPTPIKRRKPDAAVPLLKGGPVMVGQTLADRIREDVARCPLCISSHDRGHTCPACGSKPDGESA